MSNEELEQNLRCNVYQVMIIPKNDNAFAHMVEYLFDFDIKTMSNNVCIYIYIYCWHEI